MRGWNWYGTMVLTTDEAFSERHYEPQWFSGIHRKLDVSEWFWHVHFRGVPLRSGLVNSYAAAQAAISSTCMTFGLHVEHEQYVDNSPAWHKAKGR